MSKTNIGAIRTISVTMIKSADHFRGNSGEKPTTNSTAIKMRPDGRAYESGQMVRQSFMSALDHYLLQNDAYKKYYVGNADGVNDDILHNLRADYGGYVNPKGEGRYSRCRRSPLFATPSVSLDPVKVSFDTLVRLLVSDNYPSEQNRRADADQELRAQNKKSKSVKSEVDDDQGAEDSDEYVNNRKQIITSIEYGTSARFRTTLALDTVMIGRHRDFTYVKGMNVGSYYVDMITAEERAFRYRAFLYASGAMVDFASQARNMNSGEPEEVLIVFDPKYSAKICQYYATSNEIKRRNILRELDARGAVYFTGDDNTEEGDCVFEAYDKAFQYLDTCNFVVPPTKSSITDR